MESRQVRKYPKYYIFFTSVTVCCVYFSWLSYTDKKENKIFLIYKEIQNGAVAKSYVTNGLLIYG
jgi:hypothetical protein